MEIHKTESEGWLTAAYLVDDGHGTGVLIDGNGVGAPLLEIARERDLTIAAILLTHHHADHIMLDEYLGLTSPLVGHQLTADNMGKLDQLVADGEELQLGKLTVEALHTPGHVNGHLAFLIDGTDLFTGDVLFAGTVGGTRGPQATGLDDLRASLRRFAALPPETRIHPGHREGSTIGAELKDNVFLKALLSGDTPEQGEPVTVGGEPAELLLWGPDYDGTHKAWVRFPDGTEHITGGSQVERN
ncbi:MAG: MBL fold metallo-hydrolase [Solirubrobacterales bacterium]|nr:MBL fold metallo-hydrolase [Solirubrobacterales bacterium]